VKLATTALAALLALALSACGDSDGGGSSDGGDQTATDRAALEESAWVLSGGIDVDDWEQAPPSINFERGQLGGSSGCNTYGASYELDGSDLRIGGISSTAMACPPPAMEVEEAFMPKLEAISEWEVDDGELVLDGGEGELRFRAASPLGSWRATSILQGDAVKTLPAESWEITAEFDPEGGISGSGGCNLYGTSSRTRGGSIRIEVPERTEVLCEPAVMAREKAYLEALPRAAEFRLDNGNLVLLTAKGTILASFEPAEDED